MILGASSVVNAQELERKKQKLLNSGAAVNSVRMCTICNVACKSFEVFAKHLSGRRHPAQAGLIAVMALDLISLRSELMITLGIKARRQRRSFNLLGVMSAKLTATATMPMQNTCPGKNT
ncbi:uncharacterized protein LOC120170536 [Hibiscus syriacus]|uniref:uncharacterized protein LOC120170536 n=1 Tax=Hibiscus syriacus TaxID=106335 RepID=UPI00192513CA|nr:uncharacterized protein LOC120170536 [Hibiscus syriacus]